MFRKLSNASVENFYEFAVVFCHHVVRLVTGFRRLDVIFDRYFKNCLKAQSREGSVSGGTRLVSDDVSFPQNFLHSFLGNSENKNDLGIFLASKLVSIHRDVGTPHLQVCVTYNDIIISLPQMGPSVFEIKSTSEEADQKIVRHALHCITSHHTDIEIQSIILLLAYIVLQMDSSNNITVNVFFKLVTPTPKWYNVVSLINELGTDICKGFPFFYAFTGCDSVSSFNGKGKCTFWDQWKRSEMKDDMTRTFIKLSNMPGSIDNDDIYVLETLVKSVYFRGMKNLNEKSLNELRKVQFIQSTSNDMKKLAPSSDALYMHSLRATHTAGFEWVECLHNVVLPDPSVRGYIMKNDIYVPKWLRNPPTFVLATFLQTCKYKTATCKSCKCAQLKIPCLPLCHCNRQCKRL